jgi:hypothetical protein
VLINDNDLIDELRDGMRAHTDRTEVPQGFVDHARRTARRRSARLARPPRTEPRPSMVSDDQAHDAGAARRMDEHALRQFADVPPVQSFSESPADAQDPSAGTDTTTEKWLPATAGNIANAQLAQIPADYTQVSQTELEKANPAGR